MTSPWTIETVRETDLVDLLPLLRLYCEFYHQTENIPITSDESLLSVCRSLIADPQHEGMQLIVRKVDDRRAIGFATLFWSWSTLKGGRLATMEDLYVCEEFRGQGIADLLIKECIQKSRDHQAVCLTWVTSVDNRRAQAVYDRCGALRSDRWLNYSISFD